MDASAALLLLCCCFAAAVTKIFIRRQSVSIITTNSNATFNNGKNWNNRHVDGIVYAQWIATWSMDDLLSQLKANGNKAKDKKTKAKQIQCALNETDFFHYYFLSFYACSVNEGVLLPSRRSFVRYVFREIFVSRLCASPNSHFFLMFYFYSKLFYIVGHLKEYFRTLKANSRRSINVQLIDIFTLFYFFKENSFQIRNLTFNLVKAVYVFTCHFVLTYWLYATLFYFCPFETGEKKKSNALP